MALSPKCRWILTLLYDVLFAICGFLFLCFNAYILYKLATYKTLIGVDSIAPLILHVVLGFLYLFMSWCGWRAASTVHGFHLKLYCALLTLTTLIHFACVVWIICIITGPMKNEINQNAEVQFDLSVSGDEDAKNLWEGIQASMQCCGKGGPTDYRQSKSVSWSCCKRAEESGDCQTLYQKGCLLSIYDDVYNHLVYAGLSSFGMMIIKIIGILVYCSLIKSMRSRNISINQTLPQTEASVNLLRSQNPPKY